MLEIVADAGGERGPHFLRRGARVPAMGAQALCDLVGEGLCVGFAAGGFDPALADFGGALRVGQHGNQVIGDGAAFMFDEGERAWQRGCGRGDAAEDQHMAA